MRVILRGAPRVHRNLPWTFGELAYFTIDRDDVAHSCAALRFHALPVHVRKGLRKWGSRLRHPRKSGMLEKLI